MNTRHIAQHTYSGQKAQSARNRSQSRTPHRERDFGVGYGNSSGYASANPRRYADSWAKQPFSCW
jgi:hypothetical protein